MSQNLEASQPRHVSVLPNEVLTALEPQPANIVVDATGGAGGHSRLIGERLGTSGRLIVLDHDAAMLALARQRLAGLACPFHLFQASFDQVREVLNRLKIEAVDGVLADLGICSDQLDDPLRGFSFQKAGPLDMRMNAEQGETAAQLLARLGEREMADIFFRFGEERFSRRIARRIVTLRETEAITTTEQLAEIVRRCLPRPKGPSIDPATRVFQALRIAVNDELAALEGLLQVLPRCLKPGGRAVVISFHSLEDRLVKQAFRDRDVWEDASRKPVQAGEEEIQNNPRSRSAKLRAARLRGSTQKL